MFGSLPAFTDAAYGHAMQPMGQASNFGVPYAFVVVPVMQGMPMPYGGVGYMQPSLGNYMQCPPGVAACPTLGSCMQNAPSVATDPAAGAVSASGSTSTNVRGTDSCSHGEQSVGGHAYAGLDGNGDFQAYNRQHTTRKKPSNKLLNKKLLTAARGASAPASACLQLLRDVLKEWRIESTRAKRVAQITSQKFQEQVLRLALFGCHRTSAKAAVDAAAFRTGTLIADFSCQVSNVLVDTQADDESTTSGGTLTERTQSTGLESAESSIIDRTKTIVTHLTHSSLLERAGSAFSVDSSSVCSASSVSDQGFAFLTSVATWELPRVLTGHGKIRRFGIDLGGVVFTDNSRKLVWKAVQGVRLIVSIFGAENVFIVSKVKLLKRMHLACAEELSRPGGFLEKVGIPVENVVFVPCIRGTYGKGAVCAKLGLTHFVDDRFEVLEAAFEDYDGNNRGPLVTQMNGKLFHFEYGGRGEQCPVRPKTMSDGVAAHYQAVSGWVHLLTHFDGETGPQRVLPRVEPQTRTSTTFVARQVHTHRIPVGCVEFDAPRVIDVLMRGIGEIEDFSGVKILLRGKGSPHPQPPSEDDGPLAIVIRTKANRDDAALASAISEVEALLADARRRVG